MGDEPYDGPGTADSLPLVRSNDVFYLLSHHRKRAVVFALAMAPWGRVHLRQLAEVLCLLEADGERCTLSTRQVTNLRTNLKRSHLPPLVEAGVVSWTSDGNEILVPGPGFGVVLGTLCSGGASLGTPPKEG